MNYDFNLESPNGQQDFKNWVSRTIKNEVNSYTRQVLGTSNTSSLTLGTTASVFNSSVMTSPLETYNTIGALTGTVNYDAKTQSVLYSNANATANWTLNIRGDSSTSLNSMLKVGQAITLALIVQQGTTAYYQTALQIDGTSVTPKWANAVAPTFGNASANDIYTFTILKVDNTPSYIVLESQGKWGL
jgi:hypothetical protein